MCETMCETMCEYPNIVSNFQVQYLNEETFLNFYNSQHFVIDKFLYFVIGYIFYNMTISSTKKYIGKFEKHILIHLKELKYLKQQIANNEKTIDSESESESCDSENEGENDSCDSYSSERLQKLLDISGDESLPHYLQSLYQQELTYNLNLERVAKKDGGDRYTCDEFKIYVPQKISRYEQKQEGNPYKTINVTLSKTVGVYELILEQAAKKSGGDRYVSDDFNAVYLPKKISRENGVPLRNVFLTIDFV